VLCTLHHDFDAELTDLYRRVPQVKLIAISRVPGAARARQGVAVVHHGLEPSRFLCLPEQGYLLFLGRYDRVKGVTEAIEVAVRAGVPLVMAGAPHEREYYQEEVAPLIAKHGVLEVGPVGGERRRR